MSETNTNVARPSAWPTGNWRTPQYRARMFCSYVFFALVCAVCVICITLSLREDDTTTAKYCVAVIVFVALLIAFNLTYRPKSNGRLTVRDRVVRGEPAPTISYSRRTPAMLRAVTGVFGLIFATAAYDSRPQPDPDAILPVPESDGYGTTVVYALVALYFWSHNLIFVIGRLQVGYVAFTSEGVYQRGWSFESFLPWRAVLGVHAAYQEYPMTLIIAHNDSWERGYTTRFWRIDRLPILALIEIDHRKMGDDAVRIHDYVAAKVAEKTGR